ncbi:MAG: FimB/Mfa2 family fimbrial subunit [Tannerella sp.]|jgi:hypothetical protein|nr:FimB/Mfa2 family fimbrial subunit [Tannerella sp.]
MKKKPNWIKTWGVALLGLVSSVMSVLLIQGCMKDSLEECGVTLIVRYTDNPVSRLNSSEDLLASEVDNFTLFIFDKNGKFVDSYPVNGPLHNGYALSFPLLEGTYDFIVWGNLFEDFELPNLIKGVTSKTDVALMLSHVENGIMRDTIPNLYFGHTETAIKSAPQQSQIVEVTLMQNVKTVTVTIKGDGTEDADEFRQFLESLDCYIQSRNSGVRFDNNLNGIEMIEFETYKPPRIETAADGSVSLVLDYMLLREVQDLLRSKPSESKLHVVNSLGVDLVLDLADYMLQEAETRSDYNNKLDWLYHFDVLITIENKTSMTATITINAWSETGGSTDVGWS